MTTNKGVKVMAKEQAFLGVILLVVVLGVPMGTLFYLGHQSRNVRKAKSVDYPDEHLYI